jgi:HAMP domain-containing protein
MRTPEGTPAQKSILLTQILAIFLPVLTIAGGIWAAAGWTTALDNKLSRVEDRLATLETKTSGATSMEARIGQLEYRLNWMDEEKNRDRNERRQIDRDIREALDRLNSVVIRLEANAPYKRQR